MAAMHMVPLAPDPRQPCTPAASQGSSSGWEWRLGGFPCIPPTAERRASPCGLLVRVAPRRLRPPHCLLCFRLQSIRSQLFTWDPALSPWSQAASPSTVCPLIWGHTSPGSCAPPSLGRASWLLHRQDTGLSFILLAVTTAFWLVFLAGGEGTRPSVSLPVRSPLLDHKLRAGWVSFL